MNLVFIGAEVPWKEFLGKLYFIDFKEVFSCPISTDLCKLRVFLFTVSNLRLGSRMMITFLGSLPLERAPIMM